MLIFHVKSICSVPNSHMHIFIMTVIYLQNVQKIQGKMLEELISQNMHYR